MISLLALAMMRRLYGDVARGRLGLVRVLAAQDVVLVFPGDSSFGGTYRGRAELLAWLRRFADLGPRIEVLSAVAGGPPWNMRVAVRLDDAIGSDYRNEVLELLTLRWGRLHRLEVFLDTERITAWEARRAQL